MSTITSQVQLILRTLNFENFEFTLTLKLKTYRFQEAIEEANYFIKIFRIAFHK